LLVGLIKKPLQVHEKNLSSFLLFSSEIMLMLLQAMSWPLCYGRAITNRIKLVIHT